MNTLDKKTQLTATQAAQLAQYYTIVGPRFYHFRDLLDSMKSKGIPHEAAVILGSRCARTLYNEWRGGVRTPQIEKNQFHSRFRSSANIQRSFGGVVDMLRNNGMSHGRAIMLASKLRPDLFNKRMGGEKS